jgi:hypothetical protein
MNTICRDDDMGTTDTTRNRGLLILGAVAVALLYLGSISEITFADVDLWHEMALCREALKSRWIPFEDHFAYTPTIVPTVHHEWGTGVICYFIAVTTGAPGIMIFKYLLTAAVAWTCYSCARRQGASPELFVTVAPFALTITSFGFTTIRAQVFTLFFVALLFLFLELDRQGQRRWLFLWIPAYLLWLNLHGGFVVGLILLGIHAAEQLVRRQPIKHLVAAEIVMCALILVNPYGWYYGPYLWRALQMDRSMITEWQPIWAQWPDNLSALSFALLAFIAVLYAAWAKGLARVPGLAMVLACAYAGARHYRHLSLFGIAWLCFTPAYLEGTRLGEIFRNFWRDQRAILAVFFVAMGTFGAYQAVQNRFWELRVPFRELPSYPVGAVAYLHENHFHGNIVVPFEMGAFVSWKLQPDSVLVSIDSRFEVAYQSGAVEENMAFVAGQPGWKDFLRKYRTDAVLMYRDKPVVPLMTTENDWPCVYQDDIFVLFVRPQYKFPIVDRRGEEMTGTFP